MTQVSKLNSTPGATANSVIKEMGWSNLFTRGLPLRVLMVGTLTGLQWGIYDAYKVYVGLCVPPPPPCHSPHPRPPQPVLPLLLTARTQPSLIDIGHCIALL